MASGFIILEDGRCLSVRHAIHDALLRSIGRAIPEGVPMRGWLLAQIPEAGDSDMGYAFVAPSGAHVKRYVDLRGLAEASRAAFVTAARECEPVAGERAPLEDVASTLGRLRTMLDCCERGDPPLDLSDWTELAPPCKTRIGPGWDASA